MAVEITMPQLSDTMSEGKILTWFKKEGDTVKRGEALAEVATDKADLEIESFHQGTLLKVLVPSGTTVQVGAVIAIVGEPTENVAAIERLPRATPSVKPREIVAVTPMDAPNLVTESGLPVSREEGDRIRISPLARNIAQAYNVDIAALKGTGEGGRIVKRDIESYLGHEISEEEIEDRSIPIEIERPLPAFSSSAIETRALAEEPRPEAVRLVPAAGLRMRQAIAARMVESKTTIPHFYMTARLLVDNLARLKASLKAHPRYQGLTYNHLLIKAAALALKAVPQLNAVYEANGVRMRPEINIGVITALTEGLLIPVVKGADRLPLADIVTQTKALVERARSAKPKPDDLVGATFNISNIGQYPVENFIGIIGPGQSGILAIGSIMEEAVVVEGAVRPAATMRVTLSADHRSIDGVQAGEYLRELKRLVEDPVLLLA